MCEMRLGGSWGDLIQSVLCLPWKGTHKRRCFYILIDNSKDNVQAIIHAFTQFRVYAPNIGVMEDKNIFLIK